jgi:hypothetical protein
LLTHKDITARVSQVLDRYFEHSKDLWDEFNTVAMAAVREKRAEAAAAEAAAAEMEGDGQQEPAEEPEQEVPEKRRRKV